MSISTLLGVASASEPAQANVESNGIVGEWIWSSTIYEAGEDGAEAILSRCAANGITDVYILIKGTKGNLAYLNTEYKNLSYTDRDVLQEAIDAGHAHGIRVHAWICNTEDANYRAAHPKAGMYHYNTGYSSNRINLYDEGYLEYMQNVVRELAAYDIDGLHLDYLRYNQDRKSVV